MSVNGSFAPGAVVRDNPLSIQARDTRALVAEIGPMPRQLYSMAGYESRGAKNVNAFRLVGLGSRFGVWPRSMASLGHLTLLKIESSQTSATRTWAG
jgi:hypothetical protein